MGLRERHTIDFEKADCEWGPEIEAGPGEKAKSEFEIESHSTHG